MSHLRSSLHLRAILVLTLFVLGGALLAYAASNPTSALTSISQPFRTEFGTLAEQEAVRTDRDISRLPLRSTCTVVPEKELFITHTSVVDDCWRTTWSSSCPAPTATPARRGAWTLGGLLPGIFGTNDPAELSRLALRWFREWETAQTVNGESVPARPLITDLIVNPWLTASGGVQLDMKKAPFRLLAIVSRLDLRQSPSLAQTFDYVEGGISAGEARFIFNVLHNGQPTEFNVIVEYELIAGDCADILAWADDWHALGAHSFGDGYNAALNAVTNRFTLIGAGGLDRINRSAIKQVRTNEVEMGLPWELREFHLKDGEAVPAPLVQRTVALTPALRHNRTALLADFINANTAAILGNQHTVPLTFQQESFRGGVSPNPNNRNLGWDGPGTPCYSISDPKARHLFSLNTCSGCHGDETDTVFKHVEPRAANSASTLSAFLTGGTASDRCGATRNFGDIQRRRVDLCQLLEKTCEELSREPATNMVH